MTQTRFAQQFKRQAVPNLVRQFGEEVTYYPTGGNPRTIDALVDRNNPPVFEIRTKNSDCDGISSSEVNTGGDEIKFALRTGETAVRRVIIRVEDASGGMIRLFCE